MRRALVGIAVVALATLGVPVAAHAAPPPAVTPTFTVDGTGVVKHKGRDAKIDITIQCTKGTRWAADAGDVFVFSKADAADDTDARVAIGQGGKCSGSVQHEKIVLEAYHNLLLVGSGSPEYGISVLFSSTGQYLHVERGLTGPATGPVVFLS